MKGGLMKQLIICNYFMPYNEGRVDVSTFFIFFER